MTSVPFPRPIARAMADDGDDLQFCTTCAFSHACLSQGMDKSALLDLHVLVEHVGPYHAGDVLFREGEPFEAIAAVRAGTVKTCVTDREGNEHVLGFHLPGEVIGLNAIDGHQDRTLERQRFHDRDGMCFIVAQQRDQAGLCHQGRHATPVVRWDTGDLDRVGDAKFLGLPSQFGLVWTDPYDPQACVRMSPQDMWEGGDHALVAFVAFKSPDRGNQRTNRCCLCGVGCGGQIRTVRDQHESLTWDAQRCGEQVDLETGDRNQASCTGKQRPQEPPLQATDAIAQL